MARACGRFCVSVCVHLLRRGRVGLVCFCLVGGHCGGCGGGEAGF